MSAFEKALNHSNKIGIDECDIVCSKRKVTTVRITDSNIAELKQNFEKNYGIRLINKKRIIAAHTSDEKRLPKIIEDSSRNASNIKPMKFWKSLPYNIKALPKLSETYDPKLKESESNVTDIAQQMINSSLDKKISAISGSLNIVSESFEIANSHGLHLNDEATYISGIINAESEYGGYPVSGLGHESGRTLNNFSPERIGEDAKNMCLQSINPKKCPSNIYSIIFEPYSVGELLAFVVSANFNFKTFHEKRSCFSNHFEEKIAVDDLNIIDDPHIPQGIGSKPFDDEGIATSQNVLIENGLFKRTFSNIFDSAKEDKQTTGNAARTGSPMGRSSQPIPISMPHNMRIKDGSISQDDMIKDTKRGILVGRLWYTYAVNPIKGDFSCTARSGVRIIENGDIKYPAKQVRIIHNLPVVLQNISAIGNNSKNVIQWASLPSITPSLKIEGIRVNPIN